MNIGEIAEVFIRIAEIDRNTSEHVGPAQARSLPLPYVHDFADKAGWRKEKGDFLHKGDDPLSVERKRFWERSGLMPSAQEISALEIVYEWLKGIDADQDRRALLAWARSKVGGKSFRRWCFQVEDIHPETGRRRKDRALSRVSSILARRPVQNNEKPENGVLHCGPEIEQIPDTLAEDVGKRDQLNAWAAQDAFRPFHGEEAPDFSWAEKRNELRRQREARKRKEQAKKAA